jgi:hypothetical protein
MNNIEEKITGKDLVCAYKHMYFDPKGLILRALKLNSDEACDKMLKFCIECNKEVLRLHHIENAILNDIIKSIEDYMNNPDEMLAIAKETLQDKRVKDTNKGESYEPSFNANKAKEIALNNNGNIMFYIANSIRQASNTAFLNACTKVDEHNSWYCIGASLLSTNHLLNVMTIEEQVKIFNNL